MSKDDSKKIIKNLMGQKLFDQRFAIGSTVNKFSIGWALRDAQLNSQLVKIGSVVADWTVRQQKMVINMSEEEWFPFEMCLMKPPKANQNISDFMMERIDFFYDSLKEEILMDHNKRSHILKVAFDLFEQDNFIASIPLMLTQIDGICFDHFKTFYFTAETKNIKKFPGMLQEKFSSQEHEWIYNTLRQVIDNASKKFISMRFSHIDEVDAISVLNRGGILHGHSKFLEYGNKINAYKVLSLLFYVDWMINLIQSSEVNP